MAPLPTGTVTFLFTDIEGSTRLLAELGDAYAPALEAHAAVMRGAIETHHGTEISTEGDSFFAVFPVAADAVGAAVEAQRGLTDAALPGGARISCRMGMHTGEGRLGGDSYVGMDVHRAARIAAAGHGGQVLVSDTTRALLGAALPDGVELRDLGRHRLKDIDEPERIWQLAIAGLRAEFPAIRTLQARPTNLRPPLTPLVGRQRELDRASQLLADARLLTLTGPGGSGKTRLAIELATRALPRFEDGAYFISLETITDPGIAAVTIGQQLGVLQAPNRDPADVLVDYLETKDLLLVLDNFEQLMSATTLVATALERSPRLRTVATSRVPLHIRGEQEFAVPPLAVPTEGDLPALEQLMEIESVKLFVSRAGRARPDFELTDANAADVAAINRRLDGLPLAIELAAARIKLLSPAAILSRLDDSLGMLRGGDADLPERQRTLRGAIDWSYRLLADEERLIFRRLAVFAGGFEVGAAEQVVEPPAGTDLLEVLTSLVDKSLVRADEASDDGEPRFAMLQLIREFADEELAASGERTAVERRHAAWILELVEAGAPEVERHGDVGWLARFAREHANIRAALRRTADMVLPEIGLRIAAATWRFWQMRGHVAEGRACLADGLGRADGVPPDVVAAAHTAAGGLAYWDSDADAAQVHYEAARELNATAGRTDRLPNDLYNLGFVAMVRHDPQTARSLFDESARLFAEAGDTSRVADTTGARGVVELGVNNLAAARDAMETARRLNLEIDNLPRAIDNQSVLSIIYTRLGDLAMARERAMEAAEALRTNRDVARFPLTIESAVSIALADGRPEDAVRLAAASAARRELHGGGVPNFLLDVDEVVASARAALTAVADPAAVEAAWAAGARLDDEEVAELIGHPVGAAAAPAPLG